MKRYTLFFLLPFFLPAVLHGAVEEVIVRGNSLSPLIKDGTGIKADFGFYGAHEIMRGDIAVCKLPGRTAPVVKLVRAVPGDRFALKEQEDGGALLLINGAELKNSAGILYKFSGKRKQMLQLYEKDYNGLIPAGSYLLLGDVPGGSLDSTRFGLLRREAIMGKALI